MLRVPVGFRVIRGSIGAELHVTDVGPVMPNLQRAINAPRTATAALVLAVFSVSVGYGAVLPLLPDLAARLLPLASTAVFAALVSVVVAFAVPNRRRTDSSESAPVLPALKSPTVVTKLLVLTFIVSAGIDVFEVGLALRGTQELHLTSYQIALMFMECSWGWKSFSSRATAVSRTSSQGSSICSGSRMCARLRMPP